MDWRERARQKQDEKNAKKWQQTNPLCKGCIHPCKQSAAVKILRCPRMASEPKKKRKKKTKKEDKK